VRNKVKGKVIRERETIWRLAKIRWTKMENQSKLRNIPLKDQIFQKSNLMEFDKIQAEKR